MWSSQAFCIVRRQEAIRSLPGCPSGLHPCLPPEGQTILAFLPSVVPEIALLTCHSLYSPKWGTVRAFGHRSRLGLSVAPPFGLGVPPYPCRLHDRLRPPFADCCGTPRMSRFILSHDSLTCRRSPELSSTAFDAPPPDLPPVHWMDRGFAILGSLARHRRPHIRFLVHRLASLLHASFRPRLAAGVISPLRFANPSFSIRLGRGLSPPSCRTCSAHIG